jgi:hypothetical protein
LSFRTGDVGEESAYPDGIDAASDSGFLPSVGMTKLWETSAPSTYCYAPFPTNIAFNLEPSPPS